MLLMTPPTWLTIGSRVPLSLVPLAGDLSVQHPDMEEEEETCPPSPHKHLCALILKVCPPSPVLSRYHRASLLFWSLWRQTWVPSPAQPWIESPSSVSSWRGG
ncbi:unnamed protein product [Pleuronectes platessa]|uniref:Uncharacterized protein n=1 Tax=Pleuronectes platessa TaxID=8262 RepID=A0A9N7U6J3_PLEPL|nr:unnamed protein product [Pleuronectes platessa]